MKFSRIGLKKDRRTGPGQTVEIFLCSGLLLYQIEQPGVGVWLFRRPLKLLLAA